MKKKLYRIKIALEDKIGLVSDHFESINVLAVTAEEALKVVKENLGKEGDHFVHEIECLGVVDIEVSS